MSLPQRVTKTHATGNDFVVYLDKSGKFEPTADEVRFLCDRHFGIGGDGLIRLTRPDFVSDLSDDQLSDVLAGGRENGSWTIAMRMDRWRRCAATVHAPSPCSLSVRGWPTPPSRSASHPCRRQDSDATRQYEAVRSQRVPGRKWGSGRSAKPTPTRSPSPALRLGARYVCGYGQPACGRGDRGCLRVPASG